MENLIPVLNKLQDTFTKIGEKSIDLPQIVVVGCQSSGKSSVLESLVQKDFLPRGSGIVTRRPLNLQLIHYESKTSPREYGVFLHKPDVKYTLFDEISKEIVAETERLCGENGISDDAIGLKIYSPTVPDLTLVDLPGLTKVATEGQPHNLPQKIRAMVMKYIQPENSIILAITPANMDLANSDSLVIAREVDPSGQRTIGVLTKIDIMDQGTDCMDILQNKVYPLKLGYIGVINRSQKDINDHKPMEKVIESERRFFVTSPIYRDIAEYCGYPYLSLTLNRILIEHIKNRLPNVHSQISELLRRKNNELANYGESIGATTKEKQITIYHIIESYLESFSRILLGKADLPMQSIEGGATLMTYLTIDFPKIIKSRDLSLPFSNEEIDKIIEINTGVQPPLFFPESSFFILLRDTIEKLRSPCLDACEIIQHRIDDIHSKIDIPELNRFPKVKAALADELSNISKQQLEACQQYINTYIDIQKSWVNTSNPKLSRAKLDSITEEYNQKAELLRKLADNYLGTIKTEVSDEIPKIIHKMIINNAVETYRVTLFRSLVTHPDVSEDPDIAQRRAKCVALINALKEAYSTINEIRMIHV